MSMCVCVCVVFVAVYAMKNREELLREDGSRRMHPRRQITVN